MAKQKKRSTSIGDFIFSNPKPVKDPFAKKSLNLFSGVPEPKKDTRRTFSVSQKNQILYQQDNKCASSLCKHKKLDPRAIEFDHKKPWSSGGKTVVENGRALCPECHKIITHKTRLKKTDTKRKNNNSGLFI